MNLITSPGQSNVRAALWMAGWLSLMLIMAVAGREAQSGMSTFQVMELRAVIGFVLLYPMVRAAGGFGAMKTSRFKMHFWRNCVHYCAQYAWFAALTMIPLAQLISIEFTMPIWTAVLAVIFLSERMSRWKSLAIVLGLFGVLIIVRPNATGVDKGQLIAFMASLGFGVSVVLVKAMTRTEPVIRIIFWMLAIQAAIGLAPAIHTWRPVPFDLWGWVLLVAFCGTFSHYCMTQAMRYADATIVVPMDFLRVPLSALVGWMIYSETLDIYIATGAALILAGNLLNLVDPRKRLAAQ